MKNNNEQYVLLVEDDPNANATFKEMLQKLGLSVVEKDNKLPVASYSEAINIIENYGKKISFALLDIELNGDKNGADIAEYIIKHNYPIRIIFTTAYYQQHHVDSFSKVGTQFGTIYKPADTIDKDISLFQLQMLLMPTYPFIHYHSDIITIRGMKLNLNSDPQKQLYPRHDDGFGTMRIPLDEIAYICTGNGEIYRVEKNYCLFIGSDLKTGYYHRGSLTILLAEKLDNRFVRVNENTCINLLSRDLKVPEPKKSVVIVGGREIRITKIFREVYNNRLAAYGIG